RPEELAARRALARTLRSGKFDLGALFTIANMIDPDCAKEPRYLRFGFRRGGNRSNALADKRVAEFIRAGERAGVKIEATVQEAMEKFGLGRRQVFNIWEEWKPILTRLERKGPRSCDPRDWR